MTLEQAIGSATGACYAIGFLAKTWPKFPNHMIPTLVAVFGALMVPAMAGWSVNHAAVGLGAGLASTGLNQMARQFSNRTGNTTTIPKP